MTDFVTEAGELTRRPRGRPRKGGEGCRQTRFLPPRCAPSPLTGIRACQCARSTELGVSHNLLHQRFSSKEQLWYAAVDWGFQAIIDKVLADDDESLGPSARIKRFIKTFVMFAAEHPDLIRIMDIEAGQDSERLQHICKAYVLPMQERLGPVYEEAVAAGELREVPLQTSFFLITSGTAALFSSAALARTVFGDDVLDPDQVKAHAEAAAELIIRGLLP